MVSIHARMHRAGVGGSGNRVGAAIIKAMAVFEVSHGSRIPIKPHVILLEIISPNPFAVPFGHFDH